MFNDVIKLLSDSKTVDSYGDTVVTSTETVVFAEVLDIGTKEFYQAQASNLRPEIKFVIADYLDYHNEQNLLYKAYNESEDVLYDVIRTYRNGNTLEITCERSEDNGCS